MTVHVRENNASSVGIRTANNLNGHLFGKKQKISYGNFIVFAQS